MCIHVFIYCSLSIIAYIYLSVFFYVYILALLGALGALVELQRAMPGCGLALKGALCAKVILKQFLLFNVY